MKRPIPFLYPLISGFVCVSLILPPQSAYALRATNLHESSQKAGMEEALQESWLTPLSLFQDVRKEAAWGLAFHPDGRLVSAGEGSAISLYKPAEKNFVREPLRVKEKTLGMIREIAFSPDGNSLAAAGFGGSVRRFEISNHEGVELEMFRHSGGGSLVGMAFYPDGSKIITAKQRNHIQIQELQGERRTWKFQPYGPKRPGFQPDDRRFSAVAFLPARHWVAAARFNSGLVQVWHIEPEKNPEVAHQFMNRTRSLAVSALEFEPSRGLLAVGTAQGTVEIWGFPSGTKRMYRKLPASPRNMITALKFSPNGRLLAVGDSKGDVTLWTVSGRRLGPAEGGSHKALITSLAFDRGSNRLASSDWDGSVVVWRVAAGRQQAGAEEQQPMSEDRQFEFEFELGERLKAAGDYQRKIRVAGRVDDNAVRSALGNVRDRTRVVLPAVRSYVAGEIFSVEAQALLPAGRSKAWIGPAGTFFIVESVWREAPAELLAQALLNGDAGLLEDWNRPAVTPEDTMWQRPYVEAWQEEVSAEQAAVTEYEAAWTQWAESLPATENGPTVESPAPVEPAAPADPLPELPDTLDPARVKESIVAAVRQGFEGRAVPNTVSMTAGIFGDSFTVFVDTSGSEGAGLNLMFFALRGLKPLLPDPRAMTEKLDIPRRAGYKASFTLEEAEKMTARRHPSLEKLAAKLRVMPPQGRPPELRRTAARELIALLKEVLQDREGAMKAFRQRRGQQAEQLVKALREESDAKIQAQSEIYRAARALRKLASNHRAPAEQARPIVESLLPLFARWPRAQAEFEHFYFSDFPREGEADLTGILAYLEQDAAGQMDDWELVSLFERVPAPILDEGYYDAIKQLFLEKADEFDASLSGIRAEELDEKLLPLLRIAERVPALLNEAAIRDMVRMRAVAALPEETLIREVGKGAGLLLLDRDNKPRRFIAGGGSVTAAKALAARFLPFRPAEWHRPGDRIVLLYPSQTGLPSLLQLQLFVEDRFLTERVLPGSPEVLIGTVTPEGSVRVWRAAWAPADTAGWAEASEKIMSLSMAYIKFQSALTQEIQRQNETVIERAEQGAAIVLKIKGFQLPGGRKVVDKLWKFADLLTGSAAGLFERLLAKDLGAPAVAKIMPVIRARLGLELGELKSKRSKTGEEQASRAIRLINKMESLGAEVLAQELVVKGDFLSPWTVEGITEAQLPDLSAERSPVAEPAAAVETQGQTAEKAASIDEKIMDRLVGQAKAQKLIADDEEAALRKFILEIWVPSRPSGSYPFPRLKEAWVDFKKEQAAQLKAEQERLEAEAKEARLKAEQERLEAEAHAARLKAEQERLEAERKKQEEERQLQERVRVVEALAEQLAQTRTDDFPAALEALSQARESVGRLADPREQEARAKLQAAREKLGGAYAEAFVLQAEIDLELETNPDLTPARIDPILGRFKQQALPAVEDLPGLPDVLREEEKRLRQAVVQARVKAQPSAAELKRQQDQILASSNSPGAIADVLLLPRFQTTREAEKKMGKFAAQVKATGGKTMLPDAAALQTRADAQSKKGAAGDQYLFYRGITRLVDVLRQTAEQAGLEERTVDLADLAAGLRYEALQAQGNVVLFLRSDLFDASGLAQLDELTLAALAIDLRKALNWSEDGSRDLQLALVSDQNLARHLEIYAGWRIVEIGRKANSDPRPLPVSAVPWVAAEALASGRDLFELVVTPYLHLLEWTLPEALQELSHRVAA